MHVAVLINPAARSKAHTHVPERVVQTLRAHGHTVTTSAGGSAADSARILAELAARDDVDAIAVAGGDGTVRLALQTLAGTTTPLAVIPCGTGNDLATALGLRDVDATRAAAAILGGRTRPLDVVRARADDGTTHLFGTILASGLDSKVNDRTNRMRWPRGNARYTIALLWEFLTLSPIRYRLTMTMPDGSEQVIDEDLVVAAVANTPTYGGGVPICPDADPHDGLLDITTVRNTGRLRLATLLPRLYRGTHTSAPEVQTYRVRSVRVESAGVTAYADGDPLGSLPLTLDVLPGAVPVFVLDERGASGAD